MTELSSPGPLTHGFLFADLRGYTAYLERHGDAAGADLLDRYRALVRDIVSTSGGAEIRTEGDSFYLVFPSASRAVAAGLAIVDGATKATSADPDHPIAVGVGIHAGEAEERPDGYVGTAVNLAARVCALAQPGEVLVTDMVRGLTRTSGRYQFTPRGKPALKGITEPISLFRVEAANIAAGEGRRAPAEARSRRRLIAVGIALAATASLAALAFVGMPRPAAKPTLEPGTGGAPAAAASGGCRIGSSATLPPIADVPFYRVDASRDSLYAGPGPVCQPAVAWQQALGSGAAFVPVVAAGEVIVGDQNGLHAFDASTGHPSWTLAGSGGFTESAAADAKTGVVYAADLGGTLHAVDVRSGVERWTMALPNNGVDPLVADGLVWVGSSDGHAYGIDPSSGRISWTWNGPPGAQVNVGSVTNDTAYIQAGGALYSVHLVDKAQVWRFDGHGTTLSLPVLAADTIYVGSKGEQDAVYAIDRTTGLNRWSPPFSTAAGKDVNPGPVRGGVLYVSTAADGTYALRDNGGSYEVVWHNSDVAGGRPGSLAEQELYVQQNEGELFALRAADGATIWRTDVGARASSSPVVTGGFIYQVDDERKLLRAWAEPTLIALLGVPSGQPSASPRPSTSDPFTVIATYPWIETGIQNPASMAIGPDGNLYVLHARGNGREDASSRPTVTVIDPKSGQPIRSWGQFGSGPGQLDLTSTDDNVAWGCILVASNGDVYVCETGNFRVEVFKPDGTPVRQIGVGSLGKVQYGVLGPDGSLYTVNTWESTNGVHDGPSARQMAKFSPTGKLVWQTYPDPEHPSVELDQVGGIARLRDGHLLGFNIRAGLLIDPDTGRVAGHWGTDKQSSDLGVDESFVSVDRAGNVYLSNVGARLRIFDPTGRLLYDASSDGNSWFGSPECSGYEFWPPPVFDSEGFGYSFSCDGLVKLKVTLPPP